MTGEQERAADPRPISRFANPSASRVVTLPGPCGCPGSPHEHDTATIRTQFGGGEMDTVRAHGFTGKNFFDFGASNSAFLEVGVVDWTLLWPDPTWQQSSGKPQPIVPVPIVGGAIRLLSTDTRAFLLVELDADYDDEGNPIRADSLPNPSGARSPGSSRASASRTRTTRKRR